MRKSENLHNSQCSQPKPKIVYKNLQQIIKKSSSVQKKKSDFQLQNQNKQDEHFETFNTQVNYTQPLKQSKYLNKSNLKLSRTSSRHSLQSKQKINFFSSQDKVMKTLQKNTNLKKSAYNRADAIFTDLQDFLRQAKQVVLNSLQKNDSSYSQKELDKIELSIQQLKKSIKFQQKNENVTPSKQFKAQRTSEFNCFQDYIMNRQTTLTSTINGDTQGNIYMGTQTDDELMNCLAFKNKISRNNPNRKIHITQQLKGKQLGQKTVYELVLQQSKKKKTRL